MTPETMKTLPEESVASVPGAVKTETASAGDAAVSAGEQAPSRVIGRFASFAVVAGSMLGIGIFLSPMVVAQQVDSNWAFLGVWFLGGFFALAGAVACGELGAMIPRAGGDYVFQREAFGPSVAFASGWVLFAAIFTGSVAAVAVGICQYQLPILLDVDLSVTVASLPFSGQSLTLSHLMAVGVVILLTLLNALGTRMSASVQSLLTFLPLVAFALLAVVAMTWGGSPSPA